MAASPVSAPVPQHHRAPVHESSFQRLRSTLGLRTTASRAKKTHPAHSPTDDFGTVKPPSKGKERAAPAPSDATVAKRSSRDGEKDKERGKDARVNEKEKDKMNLMRRVTTFRGRSPAPPSPSSSAGAQGHGEYPGGFVPFASPSLRQGSMSSPTLHLLSSLSPDAADDAMTSGAKHHNHSHHSRARPGVPTGLTPRAVPPSPQPSSTTTPASVATGSGAHSKAVSPVRTRERERENQIGAPMPLGAARARVRIPPSPSTPAVHLEGRRAGDVGGDRRFGKDADRERERERERQRLREKERGRDREKERELENDSDSEDEYDTDASLSCPPTPTPGHRGSPLHMRPAPTTTVRTPAPISAPLVRRANTTTTPAAPFRARSPSTSATPGAVPGPTSPHVRRALTSASASHLPLPPPPPTRRGAASPSPARRPRGSLDVPRPAAGASTTGLAPRRASVDGPGPGLKREGDGHGRTTPVLAGMPTGGGGRPGAGRKASVEAPRRALAGNGNGTGNVSGSSAPSTPTIPHSQTKSASAVQLPSSTSSPCDSSTGRRRAEPVPAPMVVPAAIPVTAGMVRRTSNAGAQGRSGAVSPNLIAKTNGSASTPASPRGEGASRATPAAISLSSSVTASTSTPTSISTAASPSASTVHAHRAATPTRARRGTGVSPPASPTPPTSPVRTRAVSPSQRTYAQNRHFNISSGSLVLAGAGKLGSGKVQEREKDEKDEELAPLPATPLGRGIGSRNARLVGGAAGPGGNSNTDASPTKSEKTEQSAGTDETVRSSMGAGSAASTLSLQHGLPTPMDMTPRAALRTAVRMIVRVAQRPPAHMCRTAQGLKEWDEVDARLRSLSELVRVWDGKGEVDEEKERRAFLESVADGYVLCQLMNKLRASSIVRPDARSEPQVRTANVNKFIAACASYGLHPGDIFRPDDVTQSKPSPEASTRVAWTVVRLVRYAEEESKARGTDRIHMRVNVSPPGSPVNEHGGFSGGEKIWLRGQGLAREREKMEKEKEKEKGAEKSTRRARYADMDRALPPPPVGPYATGSVASRGGSISTPNLHAIFPAEGDAPEREESARVPVRKPSLNDKGGLMAWARSAAAPVARADAAGDSHRPLHSHSSTPVSPHSPTNIRQHQHHHSNVRQSVASSALSADTDTTTATASAVSSLFDARPGPYRAYPVSPGGHNYGTIRTVTTDLTSEAPSVSHTEGSALAEEVKELRRTRAALGLDNGVPAVGPISGSPGTSAKAMYGLGRERKMSEAPALDLSRVAEETDESVSSHNNHVGHHPRLRKGKWQDDVIDAFRGTPPPIDDIRGRALGHAHSASSAPPTPTTASGLSISSPRKLAIVGARRSDGPSGSPGDLPRRPTHRPRHSLDSPTSLLPRDVLRRETSPESGLSASPTRLAVRRNSTRPATRVGQYAARLSGSDHASSPDSEAGSGLGVGGTVSTAVPPAPIPFPRSVSNAGGERHSPSPSPGARFVRGRFQSDIEGSARAKMRPSSYDELGGRPAVRSRFESMVNLGGPSPQASASDLMARRDSMDGSAVRMRLIVREDGKPPTHFQLGNCIGRGQFGSVYRALNLNTGQMVAVKRIRLEGLKEEEVTTLMREVDLVKSLSHPSIVKYEGMARDDDTLSIVLEYAENGSLGQTLKAFGKLNEKLVASYVVKILEGLHYLHTSDVVHCDLKAANILTTKNGNVKLSDFGVSLNLRAMERNENKDVAGTPNWMAPEVIKLKGASTKSDIWSLGCTVIELLTGRPPYAEIANSMSVMFRIVDDDMPPIPEEASELLKHFLSQCFYKDPALRPSAELLCEHPWLKSNWLELKELRPQDSIPFLRRVSTDLHKTDVRHFAQMDGPDSPVPPSPQRALSPIGRRASAASVRPLETNEFSPREHSFVKTTFSKPVVCRVCQQSVKKSAVLCSQCSLISHAKCADNAPPTCDLRAHLLMYAQYAEKENPSSAYLNPAGSLDSPARVGQHVAMSDVPFVAHSPRTSIDAPAPAPPPASGTGTPEHPPTAFKFMAAFRRSRTSLTPEPGAVSPTSPLATSPPATPAKEKSHQKHPQKATSNATNNDATIHTNDENTPAKRRPTVLHKRPQVEREQRPLSVTSDSTGLSSLRSAATAAESFSSRQYTRAQASGSGGGSSGLNSVAGQGRASRPVVSGRSEATTEVGEHCAPPGVLPLEEGANPSKQGRKQHKAKAASASSCLVQ